MVSAIAGVFSVVVTWLFLMGPIERLNIDLLNYFFPQKPILTMLSLLQLMNNLFQLLINNGLGQENFMAALVDRLKEEGAKEIIFDVVFAEPSNNESDQAFAEAIKKAGNVTLASDLSETQGGFVSGVIETRPVALFEDAGAKVGLAGVDMDNDMVVRYHPTYENTLAGVPANLNTPPEERTKIIKYAGPDHFFNFISYYQFFVEDGIPKDAIKDKIVFIGLDLKATPDIQKATDTFPTPFTRFNSRFSPGVEVHANLYHNLVNKNWVTNPPDQEKIFYFVLMLLISFIATSNFKPVRSLFVGIVSHLITFFSLYFYLE